MKKVLKITGISLASVFVLVLIVATIACYIIFTPDRLTPIVRKQADKFLLCDTKLDTVNLTFFSSFPNFALEINNLTLSDSVNTSDTIVHVSKLSAEINVAKFLFSNSIVINSVELTDASTNIYVDSLGKANYNIINLPEEEEEEKKDSSEMTIFDMLEIGTVNINNLSGRYINEQSKINAHAQKLFIDIDGKFIDKTADAKLVFGFETIVAKIQDESNIFTRINNPEISASLKYKDNHVSGTFTTLLPDITFAMAEDTLVNRLPMEIKIPLQWNGDVSLLKLDNAHLIIDKLIFDMTGDAHIRDDKSVALDMNIDAKDWSFDNILSLVPASYSTMLEDFKTLEGRISMNANAKGIYNDSTMPIFSASMLVDNVAVHHKALVDYKFEDTKADLDVLVDLNEKTNSTANIRKLYTRTESTWLEAAGGVKNFMINPHMDLDLVMDANLPELVPLVPKSMSLDMSGRTALNVSVNTTLNDVKEQKLERIIASGTISYKDLDVLYNDSIHIKDNKGSMNVSLPSKVTNQQFKPLMSLDINGSNIFFNMIGVMEAKLGKPQLNVTVTNPLNKDKMLAAAVYFDMDTLNYKMDTLVAQVAKPKGYASFMPSKNDPKKPLFTVAYASDSINIGLGTALNFTTQKIDIKAFSRYDEAQTKPFLKWNPALLVDFNSGYLTMKGFKSDISIPEIKFKFTPRQCNIENSRIIIGESDFSLLGDITNIRNFIEKEELLEGKLNFISENTNIDELMDLVSGLGSKSKAESEEAFAENVDITKANEEGEKDSTDIIKKEPNPFMVPNGVDIVFNTKIENAVFNNTDIEGIEGKLTIKDGKVVLEQIGFTAEAAEMQLGGLYRSDRKNHLFAGLNFHLLDIDIESLIDLIPDIDSIVPMLSSFQGTGEFHLVAQTYLHGDYSPKMSTLRGAAAFEGKDLVVLDSEMFSTISKYLMFNKKTRNVVDSLAVEMTVFRNEIDVYPFHISMGKWQAVLAGRHNLDMTFNYHISLTKCPLPVRLGLDIIGNLDDMKFKLVPCKYNELYKPNRKKNEMQQRTLELKKTISDALKDKVK